MRYLIAAAMCVMLSGCFFFWVPIRTSSGGPGNTCIAAHYSVGDSIRHTDGRTGKVTRIYGPSDRCKDPAYPDLSDVDFGPK